jgi:hypothetical protein
MQKYHARLGSPSWNCHALFLLVFVSIFAGINLALYSFLYLGFNIYTFFYIWLVEFVSFGFAYETAELTLILLLPEFKLPRLDKLKAHPPVALLCCTCDDVNLRVLEKMSKQTYANLQIYILDDSQSECSRRNVDSVGLSVVRRDNRIAYKAGNLNNWLFRYGEAFRYFVVIDADSILPDYFVEEAVCYAEHPANYKIGLFESLMQTWNIDNEFVYLQSVMAPLSHRQRLRLGNRIQSMLSAGHNNLYRTAVMREIGGFNEDYLAEDYATTVELLRSGWLCMTLPIVSYERLPANLNEYAKRSARYAFQTFQLLSLKVEGIPWASRFRLVKDLHSYCLPIVALIGILLLVVFTAQYLAFASDFYLAPDRTWLSTDTALVCFWTFFIFFPVLLRTVLAGAEKISPGLCLRTTVFHSALFTCILWPTIRRLATFITGRRAGFNVTATEPLPSLREIFRLGGPGFILSWIALLTVVLNPTPAVMNLIWIVPAILSPVIIYHYQKKVL